MAANPHLTLVPAPNHQNILDHLAAVLRFHGENCDIDIEIRGYPHHDYQHVNITETGTDLLRWKTLRLSETPLVEVRLIPDPIRKDT